MLLVLCFFVLIFGRQTMSEGQITRGLAITRNKLLLVHVEACMYDRAIYYVLSM